MACGSSTQVLQQEKEQQKQQQVQEQKQEQEQGLDIMSRASEAEATLLKVFAQRQHNTCAYCLLRASTRTWHLAGCTHHHTTERGQSGVTDFGKMLLEADSHITSLNMQVKDREEELAATQQQLQMATRWLQQAADQMDTAKLTAAAQQARYSALLQSHQTLLQQLEAVASSGSDALALLEPARLGGCLEAEDSVEHQRGVTAARGVLSQLVSMHPGPSSLQSPRLSSLSRPGSTNPTPRYTLQGRPRVPPLPLAMAANPTQGTQAATALPSPAAGAAAATGGFQVLPRIVSSGSRLPSVQHTPRVSGLQNRPLVPPLPIAVAAAAAAAAAATTAGISSGMCPAYDGDAKAVGWGTSTPRCSPRCSTQRAVVLDDACIGRDGTNGGGGSLMRRRAAGAAPHDTSAAAARLALDPATARSGNGSTTAAVRMPASSTLLPVTSAASVRISSNVRQVLAAAAAAAVLLCLVSSFGWLLQAYQLALELAVYV